MSTAFNTPPAWQVVQQRAAVGQTPSGHYVDGVEVTVQVLATSSEFTVWVAQSDYTAGNVKSIIQDKYDQWAQVSGLSG